MEVLVKERDKNCVYCRIQFGTDQNNRKSKPSWEHILNDIRLNDEKNIALCCISCNASKGSKTLEKWFESNYCKKKGISQKTVAKVVQDFLSRNEGA